MGRRSSEKGSAASEQGGWFRGGRADRCSARPGGYGAGGHPIGEDSRSPLCQGSRCCARGHGLVGTGEAPTGRRPQSPASGVFLSSAGTVRHGGRTRQSHYPAAMAPAHLLHAMPPVARFRTEMTPEMSTEGAGNGQRRTRKRAGEGARSGAVHGDEAGHGSGASWGHPSGRAGPPGSNDVPRGRASSPSDRRTPRTVRTGTARDPASAVSRAVPGVLPAQFPCAPLRARRRRPRGCRDPRSAGPRR